MTFEAIGFGPVNRENQVVVLPLNRVFVRLIQDRLAHLHQ